MNMETCEAKYEATKIVDTNTVGEAKKAHKLETTLRKFWKKEALTYIKVNLGRDLQTEVDLPYSYKDLQFTFDLKPSGTVRVGVIWHEEFGGLDQVGETFSVPKKKLYR